MGTHLEKSPSVNYGDTFGKIAKYKLGGHIYCQKKKKSFFLFLILIRNFKGAGEKIRDGSVNLVRPNL